MEVTDAEKLARYREIAGATGGIRFSRPPSKDFTTALQRIGCPTQALHALSARSGSGLNIGVFGSSLSLRERESRAHVVGPIPRRQSRSVVGVGD